MIFFIDSKLMPLSLESLYSLYQENLLVFLILICQIDLSMQFLEKLNSLHQIIFF